jgi:type IV fimbrial biogenesis protein FimT
MNKPQRSCRRDAGFSLPELLMAVCVAGVLLTLAVPPFAQAIRSMTLTSEANSVLAQLHLARSEAIKRNGRVALCKSADGRSCTSSGGWEQGWIVFDDHDNTAARSANETIVFRSQALPGGYVLKGNQNVARYVSFTDAGGTRMASGAFQAGTLTLCQQSRSRTEAREIVISAVGRPRIHKTVVNQCA